MEFKLLPDFKSLPSVYETDYSQFLLHNKSPFLWLIQIPKFAHIKEVFDLEKEVWLKVMDEAYHLQGAMAVEFSADKMNLASLGNQTPQLHIHHVVRYKDDICWPNPIWGNFEEQELSMEEQAKRIGQFQSLLSKIFG